MAKSQPRKFRDLVSVLGISIIAIIVVGIIARFFYNAGYHDGVSEFQQWLQNMSGNSSGKTLA